MNFYVLHPLEIFDSTSSDFINLLTISDCYRKYPVGAKGELPLKPSRNCLAKAERMLGSSSTQRMGVLLSLTAYPRFLFSLNFGPSLSKSSVGRSPVFPLNNPYQCRRPDRFYYSQDDWPDKLRIGCRMFDGEPS